MLTGRMLDGVELSEKEALVKTIGFPAPDNNGRGGGALGSEGGPTYRRTSALGH